MIKMAAILKFKMEDEGILGKNGTCIFWIQHTFIDKKKWKKSILARISSGNQILDIADYTKMSPLQQHNHKVW